MYHDLETSFCCLLRFCRGLRIGSLYQISSAGRQGKAPSLVPRHPIYVSPSVVPPNCCKIFGFLLDYAPISFFNMDPTDFCQRPGSTSNGSDSKNLTPRNLERTSSTETPPTTWGGAEVRALYCCMLEHGKGGEGMFFRHFPPMFWSVLQSERTQIKRVYCRCGWADRWQ